MREGAQVAEWASRASPTRVSRRGQILMSEDRTLQEEIPGDCTLEAKGIVCVELVRVLGRKQRSRACARVCEWSREVDLHQLSSVASREAYLAECGHLNVANEKLALDNPSCGARPHTNKHAYIQARTEGRHGRGSRHTHLRGQRQKLRCCRSHIGQVFAAGGKLDSHHDHRPPLTTRRAAARIGKRGRLRGIRLRRLTPRRPGLKGYCTLRGASLAPTPAPPVRENVRTTQDCLASSECE